MLGTIQKADMAASGPCLMLLQRPAWHPALILEAQDVQQSGTLR